MKNTLQGINSEVDIAEYKNKYLKYEEAENTQSEQKKERRIQK